MNVFVQKMKGSVLLIQTKNEWFTSQLNLQLHHFHHSFIEYILYTPEAAFEVPDTFLSQ